MNRSSPIWADDNGPEYEPEVVDPKTRDLIRDYEKQTEIIKNQAEMLAMLIKGMRQ